MAVHSNNKHHVIPPLHDGNDTHGNVLILNWYNIMFSCGALHLNLLVIQWMVHFTVPSLSETFVWMHGAEEDNGWFFVNVKFITSARGDMNGTDGMSCMMWIY